MKNILLIGITYFYILNISFAQAQYPVIKDFGGIYQIEAATVLPDPTLVYKIVIDVFSGPESPHQLNPALNNVARMLNLHAVGGVPAQNLAVVLAIHGDATVAILNNESYEKKYEMANPNTLLIQALAEAGVKLTVCGQSLIGRGIDTSEVQKEVAIATSMLTTVTTHQLRGYAFLRF
jgi:intracellular sulfur oxidation DsrE/DsrF family protein